MKGTVADDERRTVANLLQVSMSVHEAPLPSPPPDSHLPNLMSGIFSRATRNSIALDGFSDAASSDAETNARKRVEFHPWTTNILEAQLSTPDSEVAPSLKSLPPSRDCQLSSRPILKATISSDLISRLDRQDICQSPLETMDSLIRNLAINERSVSIDAYQTMTTLIKTYDEPPEYEALKKKMASLQQYIKRDLVALDTNVETLASEERLSLSNLVMSALKVLVTMIWSPVYSPSLNDEFRVWSVDRSIRVLKEHTAPKATLLHYMHLLATQNFPTKLMSNNQRAFKILEVLQDLTEHVSGKAVVAERLLIYQKLIDQAKPVMEKRSDLWMKNLLSAMGHGFKEVRSNAISAGTRACIAFSSATQITLTARKRLAEVTGERSLSASITNRLERVLAAKEEANQIPQIWTIVLMLCNGRSSKLDSWPQLHEWLKLIQRCFNCSDTTVRVQSFMAWNRLYFIARPHEASDKVISMLGKPAMVQLDRPDNNQSGKGTRAAVVSSYCMLLYYAFRPSASSAQYTKMWNEFVVKLMTRSFLSKSSANCDLCCRVLSALFHSSTSASRIWNEHRAHENAPLDPLELPAIDNKWIRSHTTSILSILHLLVQFSSFGPDGNVSEQAYIAQTWRSLLRAVRESSSKEVMVSSDTKAASQSILQFLMGTKDVQETSEKSIPDLQSGLLVKIAVDELGHATVLQALEDFNGQRTGVVLREILLKLDPVGATASQSLIQGMLLDRCISVLSEELGSVTSEPTLSSARDKLLDSAGYCMQAIPSAYAEKSLSRLEKSIISQLKAGSTDSNIQQLEAHQGHDSFFSAILRLIGCVRVSGYRHLDELLSNVLTSENSQLREAFLAKQDDAWEANHSSFGPKLLQAVTKLSSHPATNVAESSPSTSKSSFLARVTRSVQASKLRHNDSQVEFVSIESSPPDYENFESQLLTARQKEVRHRQSTEPTLTFADIRSSPSTKSMKKNNDTGSTPASVSGESPEIQATPTSPNQRGQEEDDGPPTPTPKTRRSQENHLRPDVPSSPPSVTGGEARDEAAPAITSSPVKDAYEYDDAIRLEAEDQDAITSEGDREEIIEEIAVNGEDLEQVQLQAFPQARAPSPEIPLPMMHPTTGQSSNDQFETAESDAVTSESYSDEIDALAASQLSQSLVNESRSVPAHTELGPVSPKKTMKRKRFDEQRPENVRSKRRRSSEVLNTLGNERDSADDQQGDCIVVSMDRHPPRPSSRRGRSAKQAIAETSRGTQSPALSQTSQKSAASTPSSQESKGKRKARTKRNKRSKPSRDTSPITQIPIEKTTEIGPEHDEPATQEDADTTLPDPPSLTSEVEETATEDVCVPLSARPIQETDERVALPTQEIQSEVNKPTPEAEGSVQAGVAPAPALYSQSDHTDLNVVQSLQDILTKLGNPQAFAIEQDIDLAAIHSLCFQIGLKAQQLAQQ